MGDGQIRAPPPRIHALHILQCGLGRDRGRDIHSATRSSYRPLWWPCLQLTPMPSPIPILVATLSGRGGGWGVSPWPDLAKRDPWHLVVGHFYLPS